MSRLSKINKLREFLHAEKVEAEARRKLHRSHHPKPVAKSEANLTPKRKAAREKRGDTL